MKKRLLFIGAVVLVVSSAASAGTWDWLWGAIWGGSRPHSQWQVGSVTAVNAVVNRGQGTASNSQNATFTGTQSSPQGTQSATVTVNQSATVTGTSANSFGAIFSQIKVTTFQKQRF